MMATTDKKRVYNAVAYYRLSKDDRTNRESDSIANQRKLIHEYVSKQSNICLVKELHDDGYTGTNFNRPGFCAVMDAIRDGEVDCVIVKDLSRLGREYIEAGKYLETIFPSMNVRFIAINDDVDSDNYNPNNDIIIPIKNLINESYCRELSKKLRKQFQVQRQNGEFLGAFASYGYIKCPNDKHKLLVDEYAADVVREIFSLKMQGYSQQAIANALNGMQILPPAEHKKQKGLNYKSGFTSVNEPKWSAVTVRIILTNPIYVGDLVQGKRSTPSFKVKKMQKQNPEKWVTVKDNHEAIISSLIFYAVQKILQRDTRTSPKEETVHPLAGILFCQDCGRSMTRRSVQRGSKRFYYFVCSTNKRGEGCSSHSVEKGKLENAVFHAIQQQIQMIVKMDDLLQDIKENDLLAAKLKKLDLRILEKEKDLEKYGAFQMKLYEVLSEGLIEREEYLRMKEKYKKMIEGAQAIVYSFLDERKKLLTDSSFERTWIDQFEKYKNISELSREVIVNLLNRIYVHENKHIQIEFAYRDEIAYYTSIIQSMEAGQYGA